MKKYFNEIRVIEHVNTPSRDLSKLQNDDEQEISKNDVWYDIEFAYSKQPKNFVDYMFVYGDVTKSSTIHNDYVYQPKNTYQFLQAMKHTEILPDGVNGYVKGPLIIMDPKTHKVPYVKDQPIPLYTVLAAACDKFFTVEEVEKDPYKVDKFMEKFMRVCQECADIPVNEIDSRLSKSE